MRWARCSLQRVRSVGSPWQFVAQRVAGGPLLEFYAREVWQTGLRARSHLRSAQSVTSQKAAFSVTTDSCAVGISRPLHPDHLDAVQRHPFMEIVASRPRIPRLRPRPHRFRLFRTAATSTAATRASCTKVRDGGLVSCFHGLSALLSSRGQRAVTADLRHGDSNQARVDSAADPPQTAGFY
jgi:hypothetical protein